MTPWSLVGIAWKWKEECDKEFKWELTDDKPYVPMVFISFEDARSFIQKRNYSDLIDVFPVEIFLSGRVRCDK